MSVLEYLGFRNVCIRVSRYLGMKSESEVYERKTYTEDLIQPQDALLM